VALFVLIVVGVVVAQTWFDWRQARKDWIIPDWAKGAALGGVFAVCLAAATSFATALMDDSSSQFAGFGARTIWSQALFLIVMMAIVITAARNKRMRWTILAAGGLVAVFWLGITLSS